MEPINVMVNGLPGNVSTVVARHIANHDKLQLLPYSLTGPGIEIKQHPIGDINVELILPEDHEGKLKQLMAEEGAWITVDFTHPTAVNANAEFYCRMGLPFVMGTTGGDRKKLEETVAGSSIAAVIAPNMAKQIVGFQAMMAYAAETFPNLFAGYSLEIRESHQQGKADTSGTAKAMVGYFNALGLSFDVAQIRKERDSGVQHKEWGVPEEFLSGHGWHTYTLVSPDGTVRFEFTHNVNGREIYGPGAIDAVLYLNEKLAQKASGKVYTMIDVLKGV